MQCKFSSGKLYAKQLCDASDFLALSEHGLYKCEMNKIEQIHPEFMGFGKPDKHLDDKNFGQIKGYNGCALIWKKSLNNRITRLPELGSDRICVAKIKMSEKLNCYIIAVYLPHQSCRIASFEDEVAALESVIIECLTDGQVLIIGDENVQLCLDYGLRGSPISSRHGDLLMRMFLKYKIMCYDLLYATGPKYTYEKAGIRTYIDHVFVTDGLLEYVDKCEIMNDVIQNVSDHLPIWISLRTRIPAIKPSVDIRKRVAWNKISRTEIALKYTAPLENEVMKIIQKSNLLIEHSDDGSIVVSRKQGEEYDVLTIIRSLSCSINTISAELPQIRFNKSLKSFWDPNLKVLSKEGKAAKRAWVAAGQPCDVDNEIHKNYKKAKADFQRERRRTEIAYEVKNLSELGDYESIDSRFFWHLYRKFMKTKSTVNPIKDDKGVLLTESIDIRKEWMLYYKNLYDVKDDYGGDTHFKQQVDTCINNVAAIPSVGKYMKGGKFLCSELNKQISKMKPNRAPGWDEITAEHLKHSGEAFRGILTWIFNEIVLSEEIPIYFKKGYIVSIPKPGKSYVIKDNNRGITLLPVFYKLFELVMLERESEWFEKNLDNLQGAAQKRCSCQHTSMLVQEAVAYNVEKGETVYCGLGDIKKAFDTVWINGLLYKLHIGEIDIKTWKLIRNGYIDFKCAAFVDGQPSDWFPIRRGVHQGAPFSMKLYQVTINSLLEQLQDSGYGLQLGPIDCTCPTSADDIAMLSIHKHGLNSLLMIAYEYSKTWWFEWGFSKCFGLIWGKDKSPDIPIKFGNTALQIVDKSKHLGILLHNNNVSSSDIISTRIGDGRSSLLAARGMGSKCVPVNPIVLSRIYWSVSIPRMLFGAETVPISDNDCQELEKAHRNNARIIMNVPQSVANPAVYSTLGWLSMESYIAQMKILFLWKIAVILRDTIYFRALSFILGLIIRGKYSSALSPICDMANRFCKFDMYHDLIDCVFAIECDRNYLADKLSIKKHIFNIEIERWRATCLMYSSLRIYTMATNSIQMSCWWFFAKTMPKAMRKTSSVVSVLMGNQPSKYQQNLSRDPCALCDYQGYDDNIHVLFDCDKLEPQRSRLYEKLTASMPNALCQNFRDMNKDEKAVLMLSGYGNTYIHEWSELYLNTVEYVDSLYKLRSNLYDTLPIDNG